MRDPKTGKLLHCPPTKRKPNCSHDKACDFRGSQLNQDELEYDVKRASESVVGILCRNLQGRMFLHRGWQYTKWVNGEIMLPGTGIIIECEDAGDGTYLSTILAPAILLGHITNVPFPVQRTHIEVDVYLSDSKLYKGQVLACDVHYNLAAISIQSDSPLTTAVLRGLDDIASLDLNELHQLCSDQSFQLRPHSNLFRIMPRTKIMVLRRLFIPPYKLQVDSGVFCADPVCRFDSRFHPTELCWLHDITYEDNYGGAVMNCFGEVIGIMFYDSPFLPSNFIISWWNNYKRNREFIRPWLGMDLFNLYAANMGFLEKLKKLFAISTGIVVTKVENDSPAHMSGIMPQDVIVKCDGLLVRSKVEFLKKIWHCSDRSVKLEILRASDCCRLNLKLAIGKTAPDKVYRWPLLSWEWYKEIFHLPESRQFHNRSIL